MKQIKFTLLMIVMLGILTCQETKKKDDTSTIVGLLAVQQSQQKSTTPALGSSCNTTGVASGCTTSSPYSCSAISNCYSSLSTCQGNSACSGMYAVPAQNGYYAVNSPITTISTTIANNSGGTFSVSPSLPTGLSLNTTNGQITGTPTATTSSKTNYTVTASFGSTRFTGTVSLQIVASMTPYTCVPSGLCTTSPFLISCPNSNSCFSNSNTCAGDSSCGL